MYKSMCKSVFVCLPSSGTSAAQPSTLVLEASKNSTTVLFPDW